LRGGIRHGIETRATEKLAAAVEQRSAARPVV